MKIPFEKKYWFIILIMPIYMQSCCREYSLIKTTLSLTNFHVAQLDSGQLTTLEILQIYPAQNKCNATDKCANFYICRKLNGDSIYVFEECKKVSDLAYSAEHYMGIIDNDNLPIQNSKEVMIFTPKDFKFSSSVKYIFSKMGYLTEY